MAKCTVNSHKELKMKMERNQVRQECEKHYELNQTMCEVLKGVESFTMDEVYSCPEHISNKNEMNKECNKPSHLSIQHVYIKKSAW